MAWTRAKLEEVAGKRLAQRAQLEPVEQAALAYARWQGLTDEDRVDRDTAKLSLDEALATLDAQGPDGWNNLTKLAQELGDTAVIGLMQHSLRRSIEHVHDQARATDKVPDEAEGDSSPKPVKNRGKSMDM